MKVFNCELYGHITIKDCQKCQSYQKYDLQNWTHSMMETDLKSLPAEACNTARKDMSVAEMLDLIKSAPPGPWPTKKEYRNGKHHDVPDQTWHCWSNTQEAMRILADNYAENMPFYPGHYEGRGIIIAGGGPKYMPSVWVNIRKLRHIGCRLPIQVWHLGSMEMDPYMRRVLKKLGVECVDARSVEKHIPARVLCGWELKAYAITHCPFREVLFLDADNHVLSDPEVFFDEPEYKRHGAIFWPDYDFWTLSKGVFQVFGIPYKRERAFESGQLLINKEVTWRGLCMCQWYGEHSDFVFGHVYGDKECFHLGWRKVGLDYAMPSRGPDWGEGVCIIQMDFSGKPFFLHRVQDKWKLNGGNKKCNLPDEALHWQFLAELRGLWPGKMWSNPVPNSRESEVIRKLHHSSFIYKRLEKQGFSGDERTIELLPGGRIGDGAAEKECRWEVNEVFSKRNATMTLSLCADDRPTCHLTWNKDRWVGQWEEHERCLVELVPIEVNPEASVIKDRSRMLRDMSGILRKYGYSCGDEQIKKLVEELCVPLILEEDE